VVEIEITDERVHDSQKVQELVKGAKKEAKEKGKKVSKVIGQAGQGIGLLLDKASLLQDGGYENPHPRWWVWDEALAPFKKKLSKTIP